MKKILLLFIFSCILLNANINQYLPKKDGNIIDQENIISPNVKNEINFILQDHQKRKSNQIIFVILKSLNNYRIDDYSTQLRQYWKLEDKSILVLISMEEKQININVPSELKNRVSDEIVNEIIEFTLKPNFKAKQYELGTLKTINEIILALQYEYVPKVNKTNFSTNNFMTIATFCFFVVMFFSLFINSISQKTKSFVIYKVSKSILYSSFFSFTILLISKEYTIYYLIIFILSFLIIFLISYFTIIRFNNFSLNEYSISDLSTNNFEETSNKLINISKNNSQNKKEFLKQQQGNANANW